MDLLFNEECDTECNHTYCQQYLYESSFTTPVTVSYSGQLYAADDWRCPYGSSDSLLNYSLCTQSATDSIFIDANVPAEKYELCQAEWIGDGIC